jgi:hypothetical protein
MQSEKTMPQRASTEAGWQRLLSESGLLKDISNGFPRLNSANVSTLPEKLAAIGSGLLTNGAG